MADPRFYDNRGPIALADVCVKAEAALPVGADGSAKIEDVASLVGAAAAHLSYHTGKGTASVFARTSAGFCFVPATGHKPAEPPAAMVAIPCASPQHAFAAAAQLFYPDANLAIWAQDVAVHPSAEIGERVVLSPGVFIGPHAQIGDGVRIGPNTVIGRGVAVGCDCEIASNVSVSHAYIGDRVLILPGAQIGQPGFGFANGTQGHVKIPQLGRVIVQDNVEIGACVTIDRGALGDTVVGEGTKIDNLVQIGHNVHIGRHCVIVSQTGISGSCTLDDFVVLGGQVGIADHAHIGNAARLAGRSGVVTGQDVKGGKDYGGVPAKPVREWMREMYALTALVKKQKRGDND